MWKLRPEGLPWTINDEDKMSWEKWAHYGMSGGRHRPPPSSSFPGFLGPHRPHRFPVFLPPTEDEGFFPFSGKQAGVE